MEYFKYIEEHPDKHWDYNGLSQNLNITWDINIYFEVMKLQQIPVTIVI